ncbi:hypothetical protein [Halomicrococcus sp. NG-SE-24]|uniref:hypothetical protein n=1 Tax=Halomicrococcus sp. NG-SE-24 TaxID=3436928 RepID=UPI003D97E2CC
MVALINGYRFVADVWIDGIEGLMQDIDPPNTVAFPLVIFVVLVSVALLPMIFAMYYMQLVIPPRWRIPSYHEWIEANDTEMLYQQAGDPV